MEVKIPLPFNICLYDEEQKEPLDYLKGIPRPFLLKTAILFLSLNTTKSNKNELLWFLNLFFSSQNELFVNRILNNIIQYEKNQKHEKNKIEEYEVHHTLADLELLKLIFNNSKNHELDIKENILDIEINIFKAYVSINQKINNNSKKVLLPKSFEKPADLAKFFFLVNLNSFDLNNYNLLKIIISQYYKGCLFLNFLESTNDAKLLLDRFNTFYNVDSIGRYISYLSVVHLKLIQNGRITYVDMGENKLFEFYKKHSLERLNKIKQIDYNDIRSLPLLSKDEIVKNRITVINPLLTAEMFYNGLYFRLKKINDKLETGNVDLLRLKTHDFSEKTLFKKLVSKILSKKYIQFSGDLIDDLMNGGVDYYARNGNKVFLFESKDIFLSSESKISFDEEKVIKEIKTKLYHNEAKGKDKGVSQLINFIDKLINMQIPFDSKYKASSLNIFPILVLHNRIFNNSGFNCIVQSLFQKACNEKFENFKGKINPIVVIDIDTLIYDHEFFESKRINFEASLKDYIKNVMKPAFKTNKNLSMRRVEELIISYSDYLNKKTRNMERYYIKGFVTDLAKEVLPKS